MRMDRYVGPMAGAWEKAAAGDIAAARSLLDAAVRAAYPACAHIDIDVMHSRLRAHPEIARAYRRPRDWHVGAHLCSAANTLREHGLLPSVEAAAYVEPTAQNVACSLGYALRRMPDLEPALGCWDVPEGKAWHWVLGGAQ